MEILGIGPGEFVLILIILLVVVGPERLPDLARQAGRLLVRGRNWLQSSPDAAMVMRARQEIEQELANLKTSLLEVQSVRDEVLDAAKQIGDSVGSLTSAAKAELEDIGNIASLKPTNPLQDLEATLAKAHGQPSADAPAEPTIARGADLAPEAELAQDVPPAPDAAALDVPPAPDALDALDAAEPAPRVALRQPRQPPSYAEDIPAPGAPGAGALETIDLRLQAIMADLFALQQQLKQRGVLDDTWQPPSWDIQLPAEQPQHHAAPLAPPEPAEQTAHYSAPTMPAEPVATEEAPNV